MAPPGPPQGQQYFRERVFCHSCGAWLHADRLEAKKFLCKCGVRFCLPKGFRGAAAGGTAGGQRLPPGTPPKTVRGKKSGKNGDRQKPPSANGTSGGGSRTPEGSQPDKNTILVVVEHLAENFPEIRSFKQALLDGGKKEEKPAAPKRPGTAAAEAETKLHKAKASQAHCAKVIIQKDKEAAEARERFNAASDAVVLAQADFDNAAKQLQLQEASVEKTGAENLEAFLAGGGVRHEVHKLIGLDDFEGDVPSEIAKEIEAAEEQIKEAIAKAGKGVLDKLREGDLGAKVVDCKKRRTTGGSVATASAVAPDAHERGKTEETKKDDAAKEDTIDPVAASLANISEVELLCRSGVDAAKGRAKRLETAAAMEVDGLRS